MLLRQAEVPASPVTREPIVLTATCNGVSVDLDLPTSWFLLSGEHRDTAGRSDLLITNPEGVSLCLSNTTNRTT